MRYVVVAIMLIVISLTGCGDEDPASSSSTEDISLSETTIHPGFEITVTELKERTNALPEGIQNNILGRPQYFLELTRQVLDLPPHYLVLVDKEHPLPPDFAPDDLIGLNRYPVSLNRSDLRVSRAIMPDLLAMVEAARMEGIELVFSSAYRSYTYQEALYRRNVEQLGQEQADRESARAGTSQHQLGTTVDFGSITPAFADTEAGTWLAENGWKYGFSLSYPKGKESLTGYMYESWHYRYISRTGTALQYHFFEDIQHHFLTFWHENSDYFQTRQIEFE